MLKITVLCENTAGIPGVVGEWGLSLLLENSGKKILFDTGGRVSLLNNASALKVDLKSVDALVLSHGHYDHTGGMQAFLQHRGRLPVYAHPGIFARHYKTPENPVYIGIPFKQDALENLGADFIFTRETREIIPGLFFSGEISRKTTFEITPGSLFCLEKDKKIIPDPFYDDISLYFVTPAGLFIILGCAHAGLVNIVEQARKVTGVNRIYGIIGGTHLGPAPAHQQEAAIDYLRGLDLQFLAPNHCTGLPLISRLAGIFGQRFHFCPCGAVFTLPVKSNR
jgi:7,8-dihydropterin-6-yl-methyl-4-(beta-D-ribofuranosyl)aminobenzene 5'-phosphate synthase